MLQNKKPEEGWYGQPKYCSKRAIHVAISFAVVSGLFSFCAPQKWQQSLRILSRCLRTLYPPRGKTRGPGLRKVRGEDGEVGYNILWYPDPTPWRKLIGYQALPESEFWSPVELRIFRNTSTFPVCSPGIFATPYWKINFFISQKFQDECCTVYGGDDLSLSPNFVSSSSVWQLAKATLACHGGCLCGLVFLFSYRVHSPFRRFSGKFDHFTLLRKLC